MLKKWMAALSVAMLVVTGCSNNNQTAVDDEDKEVQKDITENTKEVHGNIDQEMPYRFPLTGIGTEKNPETRAVAVMINNHPKARPQSGLEEADIVYELLAEGDVTRFLAIYQSGKPEKIGPVRSARDYYIEIAKGYDSIYIAHGYSPEAKKMLENGYIDNLNGMVYDGILFKRDQTRKAPHNSYISYDSIVKGAEIRNYSMEEDEEPLTFLKKEEVQNLEGEPAHSAMINYFNNSIYNSIYEYDEKLDKYKRYSNGDLTIDQNTGDPVLLDNIFIVETNHRVIDEAGRRSIDLTSGGNAYLLQKGKWKEAQWRNIDGRILPVIDGVEAGLVPGKTWINVIPSSPGLEQTVSFDVKE